MKKVITILFGTILLFSFGDRNQNSFSQQSSQIRKLRVLPTLTEIKSDSFKKDTMSQNKLIQSAVDSLRIENAKTEEQIKTGKGIIKVQQKNQNDLWQIRSLIGKGLAQTTRDERALPEILIIYGTKKPSPIPVEIELVAPDSLIVPPVKKSFLRKLKFWK